MGSMEPSICVEPDDSSADRFRRDFSLSFHSLKLFSLNIESIVCVDSGADFAPFGLVLTTNADTNPTASKQFKRHTKLIANFDIFLVTNNTFFAISF